MAALSDPSKWRQMIEADTVGIRLEVVQLLVTTFTEANIPII